MIVKPVTAVEREQMRRFYLSLAGDDRRMRFCSTASDGVVNGYVDRLDFTGRTILAAYGEEAEIIGLGELAPVGDKGELAFAVRADMRRQGVGTWLMRRLLARARMRGLREAFVMFLWENTPMRRLALRAEMSIACERAESFGSRRLEPATAAELTRWCLEDMVSHGEHFATLMITQYGSLMSESVNASGLPLEALTNAAVMAMARNRSRVEERL